VAWTTWIAIYFIMWWTILFMVLPWGVKSQHEAGEIVPGTEPGAPSLPRLLYKAMWTTIVTSVLFVIFYAAEVNDVITIDKLAGWLGVPKY
jgi:predicted secreted protein